MAQPASPVNKELFKKPEPAKVVPTPEPVRIQEPPKPVEKPVIENTEPVQVVDSPARQE